MRQFLALVALFAVPTYALAETIQDIARSVIAQDAATRPKPTPKVFDVEAKKYADEAAKGGMLPPEHEYWGKRLELARQVDAGQISYEAADSLEHVYRQQAIEKLQAIANQIKAQDAQRQAAQQAQQAAIAQIQAMQQQAREDARKQRAFDLGMRLLFPPQPTYQPPTQCQYQTNANGSGSMICR